MSFHLTDDGTLDTVVRCSECGHEDRYTYDPCGPDADMCPDDDTADRQYREFVADCIEQSEEDHMCEGDT